jgi:hypothetical protein
MPVNTSCVPSLKEPVLSMVVSSDFSACECFELLVIEPYLQTIYAVRKSGLFDIGSCWTACFAVVSFERSSTCYCVTTFSARSVRSFFSKRDRASTRPFVDARGL